MPRRVIWLIVDLMKDKLMMMTAATQLQSNIVPTFGCFHRNSQASLVSLPAAFDTAVDCGKFLHGFEL